MSGNLILGNLSVYMLSYQEIKNKSPMYTSCLSTGLWSGSYFFLMFFFSFEIFGMDSFYLSSSCLILSEKSNLISCKSSEILFMLQYTSTRILTWFFFLICFYINTFNILCFMSHTITDFCTYSNIIFMKIWM
jgi:hypothetical protein